MESTLTRNVYSDPIITEIARLIVEQAQPELVYFFGSRCRGDHHEASDYDFMVILSNATPDDLKKQIGQTLTRLSLGVRTDTKVYTRQQFERELHLKASMSSAVLRDGVLVYRKAGVPLPQPIYTEFMVKEGDEPVYEPVRAEITRDWLEHAWADLHCTKLIEDDASTRLWGLAMFHCQQAVEKTLKAFLSWYDVVPAKTHDLEELGEASMIANKSLAFLIAESYQLIHWDVVGRYHTGHDCPDSQQLHDAIDVAQRLYDAVCQLLPEQARPSP